MAPSRTPPSSIDEYIAGSPPDTQGILQNIRRAIRKAAPEAEETISYGMPTFTLMGFLVSFAAYKKHIGFYPAPEGTKRFNEKLNVYRAAKSTVRFPFDKPIPLDLISQIVKLRVKDNVKRAASRAKKK